MGDTGRERSHVSHDGSEHLPSSPITGGAESGAVGALNTWIQACPVPLTDQQRAAILATLGKKKR
jgi:hypothetical protein